MKFGVIMGTCVPHNMQEEAWTRNRRYSRASTEIVAVINGDDWVSPFCAPLPPGVERHQVAERFREERDLWQCGYNLAVERGWDWCFFLHDDFALREGCQGWEEEIESLSEWQVGMATWNGYTFITEEANTGNIEPRRKGNLCCALDPCSIGFRMSLFRARGSFADLASKDGVAIEYGFGAFDSLGWMLSRDHAVWQLQGTTDHHWIYENTRTLMKIGAGGHQLVASQYRGIAFPAEQVDEHHIKVVDRIIRIAP